MSCDPLKRCLETVVFSIAQSSKLCFYPKHAILFVRVFSTTVFLSAGGILNSIISSISVTCVVRFHTFHPRKWQRQTLARYMYRVQVRSQHFRGLSAVYKMLTDSCRKVALDCRHQNTVFWLTSCFMQYTQHLCSQKKMSKLYNNKVQKTRDSLEQRSVFSTIISDGHLGVRCTCEACQFSVIVHEISVLGRIALQITRCFLLLNSLHIENCALVPDNATDNDDYRAWVARDCQGKGLPVLADDRLCSLLGCTKLMILLIVKIYLLHVAKPLLDLNCLLLIFFKQNFRQSRWTR